MKKRRTGNGERGTASGRDEARPSQVALVAPVAPVAETVTPEVLPSMYEVEEPDYTDAAERIRFHLHEAQAHGRCAIAHIIEAGRELALQKQLLGYGQWKTWCEGNLSLSLDTVDRYISTFQKTVGVQRASQQIPLDKKILKKELEAATVGMEEKTVRQAMLELGVIKRPSGWGGGREGAGRKAKAKDEAEEVSAQLDAVVNSPALLIAAIRKPLETVYKAWRERDVFARIDLKDLGQVAATLNELASAASAALKARSKK